MHLEQGVEQVPELQTIRKMKGSVVVTDRPLN